jgi:hypothetical protein
VFLVLEIISPEPMPSGGGRHVFGREGGTIGRGPRNSWVLTHAKVSGVHARISFEQSVFYIEDTSLNGVFLNASHNRLARGERYPLAAGDRILIDPYEIRVSIEAEERALPARPDDSAASPRSEDPFSDAVDPSRKQMPIAPGPTDAAEELDPLVLLAPDRDSRTSRKATPAEPLDRGSLLNAPYRPPAVSAPPAASPAAAPDSSDRLSPPPETVTADLVQCTVFAPPAVVAGQRAMLQVFAHVPADADRVKALAAEYDAEAKARGSKALDREVRRGTELVIALSVPGIAIDEPIQALVWRGQPDAVQFVLSVPAALAGGDLVGTVYVSQDRIPFGHVKFVLRCRRAGEQPAHDPTSLEPGWTRYAYAFISYASADRAEVLKRVQMLARCRIDFFQDLLTLEPGERWQRALYKTIDRSDVVFLFWSRAARDSEWVRKEIQYALDRKAGNEVAPPEIVPIIIEGPPPVPAPPELAALHFNDPFLYFLAGSSGGRSG